MLQAAGAGKWYNTRHGEGRVVTDELMKNESCTPKVSVVIPVYNAEAFLRQCLDSVVNQTLRSIEIICVDDGSSDGSASILAEYAASDPRMKILAHRHANAGAVRNAGIAAAKQIVDFIQNGNTRFQVNK